MQLKVRIACQLEQLRADPGKGSLRNVRSPNQTGMDLPTQFGIAGVVDLHPEPTFLPLQILPPIVDTAGLTIWAVVIFAAMGRFVSDPIRKFKTIAFIVLLLSFLPDVALVKWHVWGATWSYAFALMAMHLGACATCVTILTQLGAVREGSRPNLK